MKTIILIILTLSISCGDVPENNEVCRLLSEAIASEQLQREFFLCKDSATFILYDKHDMFKDCGLLNACGNGITISNDANKLDLRSKENHAKKTAKDPDRAGGYSKYWKNRKQ